jgi:5-formyltetrahydrofolate cyclo-ligase
MNPTGGPGAREVHEAVADDDRDTREALRKRLRELRARLGADELASASADVCARVAAQPELARARVVALYAARAGEIDPASLVAALAARGARACLPRVVAVAPPRLAFAAIAPGEPLAIGRFGIREPAPDAATVALDALDVVLVPGVAFARDGGRLGFGHGYYDAALRSSPRALRIALAHDFQLVDSLPQHEGDEPVDLILTPQARIVTRARALVPEEALP